VGGGNQGMNLHNAFLQSILDAPDDDAPRLVYADWLEEHGESERAEFIRVQVKLAQLPPQAPERAALAAREQVLLQEHSREWAEPLRGLNWGWRFVRGFIEAIQIHPFQRETVQALARVVALAPIRMLSIPDDCPEGEALVAAAPSMARLRELRFEYTDFHYGGRLSDHVQALLTSPHVTGLKKLYIVGGRNWGWLSKKALRAIITSPSLTVLTDLTLVHDWHGLAGDLIQILARTPRKAHLERLSLFESQMSPELMRELGSSRHLTHLTRVDFRKCGWERATWQALIDAPLFRQLERLYLYNTHLNDSEGRYLGDVGESCLGREHWQPDAPLREALLSRFGPSVVDFTSDEVEAPCWEGWEKWGDS
jgi:uncharacterized protein (TIGR02996 family)